MFERLRAWFGGAKESRTGAVIHDGRRQAKWTPRRYDKFAEEAYQKNVIAYQAIKKVADSAAAIPWVAKRPNGDELSEHAILSLINRPNPLQSRPEFIRALVGFFLIAGNGYMERVMVRGQPREMYTLRPDRMSLTPSETGIPSQYTYKVGQQSVNWDVDTMTGLSDIRHLKTFHPLNDWYGMSPIEAGAFAVDQHNESMQHIQSLLQNSASPSGIMVYKGEGDMTDDQLNQFKAELDEKYAGSRNAGRPMVLQDVEWTQMGLSPHDMSIIETKYSAARDISLAFGVPPLLLNIPGDSTYNNYKEARLALYEETVIPLIEYIRDELNAWLSPQFGGILLDVDLDQIPAIAEKRLELWTMADQSTDLTINERRELKGYEAVDGGDDILIPSTLIPLTFDDMSGGEILDTEAPATDQAGKVQDLALNGAQISSVAQIVQNVADGLLPPESAVNLLRVAFPTIDAETASAIVNPASGFESMRSRDDMQKHIKRCLLEKSSELTAEEIKALAYGPPIAGR